MGKDTAIEWCDHTFNIAWGCEKVSPACDNCYAEGWAKRAGYDVWGPGKTRRTFGAEHWRAPLAWNATASASRPPRVFCSSMADVFEDHPTIAAERAKLWPLIERTPNLRWLLLTKRIDLAASMVPASWAHGWPGHVAIGTTVEDQQRAEERLPALIRIPARRFVSMEPLLALVDLSFGVTSKTGYGDMATRPAIEWLQWVIAGGESGPGARPMHPEWVMEIRNRCLGAGVPFFFKQWGDFEPMMPAQAYAEEILVMDGPIREMTTGVVIQHVDGRRDTPAPPFRRWWQSWLEQQPMEDDDDLAPVAMHRVGKKVAGRKLDGAIWDDIPAEWKDTREGA